MTDNENGRIMVIDDDAALTSSAKRMLQLQRYTVAIHDGGPGCCNEVDRFAPDLVLVDVIMPFLAGDAFVGLFKPRPGMTNATIVLYSGIEDAALRKKVLECGAHGYISKNDSPLDFSRKVAEFMQMGRRKNRQWTPLR
jgi:response regulator RpfG family c-di-GMP phosphodiesterase